MGFEFNFIWILMTLLIQTSQRAFKKVEEIVNVSIFQKVAWIKCLREY